MQGHGLWLNHLLTLIQSQHHFPEAFCSSSPCSVIALLEPFAYIPPKLCVLDYRAHSYPRAFAHADLPAYRAFTPFFQLLIAPLFVLPFKAWLARFLLREAYSKMCLPLVSAHCQCFQGMFSLAPGLRISLLDRCRLLQLEKEVTVTFTATAQPYGH